MNATTTPPQPPPKARDTPVVSSWTDAPVSQPLQWFALLGGPLAWTARLLLSYPLVPVICEHGGEILLHVIALVAALISLTAAIVGWHSWREAQRDEESPEWVEQRTGFMGLAGTFTSGFFFLVILAEWLPVFLQHPCESP